MQDDVKEIVLTMCTEILKISGRSENEDELKHFFNVKPNETYIMESETPFLCIVAKLT